MAALHFNNADAEPQMGSPEHFCRTCRGAAGQRVVVFLARIEGFVVPADGAWMINGLYAASGEVRDLVEGDTVTYHRALRAPDDDRPASRLARASVAHLPGLDPLTLRPLMSGAELRRQLLRKR